MSTALRCTPYAPSRRVPSNRHRKAVAPPATLKLKSTQLSIIATANVPEELPRDHITQGQGLSEVSARLSRLMKWCPGQGSNLHAGITRRGILSRDIATNGNNRQTPTTYESMGCLLCIAVDFR